MGASLSEESEWVPGDSVAVLRVGRGSGWPRYQRSSPEREMFTSGHFLPLHPQLGRSPFGRRGDGPLGSTNSKQDTLWSGLWPCYMTSDL